MLGRFIPDFGRVVGDDAVHDVPPLHGRRASAAHRRRAQPRSRPGGSTEEHPLAQRDPAARSPTARALYVAAFLHDIAKGRREDHSIAGAEVARKLCPRLGLSAAETERVAWLVEQHLIMSNMAQSRDLSDPRTAEALRRRSCRRIERLQDAAGADRLRHPRGRPRRLERLEGPAAAHALSGRPRSCSAAAIRRSTASRASRAAQEALREALPGWSDPEFDAYAARHYPAYWLKVDLPRQIAHAKLLYAMAAEVRSLATEVATDAFRGVTELTVIAPDHPRLLSIIAGACAAAGANIVDAQIFTTTDGLALDTIFVSRAFERDEDEMRRGRAHRRAPSRRRCAARSGSARSSPPSAAATPRAEAFAIAPEVIDRQQPVAPLHGASKCPGLDRPGLLYDLTAALSKLNLNIGSAHIVTFGEKAVDSFYVTDLTGAKITSPARQAAIKRHILAIF